MFICWRLLYIKIAKLHKIFLFFKKISTNYTTKNVLAIKLENYVGFRRANYIYSNNAVRLHSNRNIPKLVKISPSKIVNLRWNYDLYLINTKTSGAKYCMLYIKVHVNSSENTLKIIQCLPFECHISLTHNLSIKCTFRILKCKLNFSGPPTLLKCCFWLKSMKCTYLKS